MDTIQITGQRINATKLRGLLFSLANSITRNADIIGSIDKDEYGTQCSFVMGDMVLGLNINALKGGML